MGKITMLLMCAFAAVAMTGCARTYSAKPYYTDKNKIDVPKQLVGQWYAAGQSRRGGQFADRQGRNRTCSGNPQGGRP